MTGGGGWTGRDRAGQSMAGRVKVGAGELRARWDGKGRGGNRGGRVGAERDERQAERGGTSGRWGGGGMRRGTSPRQGGVLGPRPA